MSGCRGAGLPVAQVMFAYKTSHWRGFAHLLTQETRARILYVLYYTLLYYTLLYTHTIYPLYHFHTAQYNVHLFSCLYNTIHPVK